LKSFSNALQLAKHSRNTLEPIHSTIQQSASCQNVSSFLFFLKLSVLVDSSSDTYNILLRPLQYQLIEVGKSALFVTHAALLVIKVRSRRSLTVESWLLVFKFRGIYAHPLCFRYLFTLLPPFPLPVGALFCLPVVLL